MEKKLDRNYTGMLRAILNMSLRQHPTKQQLYHHLPPIMKTIKFRRNRHAGHDWRSRNELINDVLQWTPSHGRAKAVQPARTYIKQLCADTGCDTEELPEAKDVRKRWRERVRDMGGDGATWWWLLYLIIFNFFLTLSIYIQYIYVYIYIYIYIYMCVCVCVCVCMFMYAYAYVHISMHVCMYIYMRIIK